MTVLSDARLDEIEKNCNRILKYDDVEFVGVINALGNLIAGGFKKDAVPIGTEETRKMMYMQLKLDLNMRKEYDGLYGPVSYVVSKRRNAEKISIPVGSNMILLITELNFDHTKIEKIMTIFKSSFDICA